MRSRPSRAPSQKCWLSPSGVGRSKRMTAGHGATIAGVGTEPGHLLVDQLRLMADHFPDEIAYRCLEVGDLTFDEWERRSNRLARGLAVQGVDKGDRVAILLPAEEALSWMIAYAAIHKAGAVAVPLNTRLTAPELAAILGHAETSVMVVGGNLVATARLLPDTVASMRLIVSTADVGDGVVGWDDVLDDDESEFQVHVSGDDLADVMYTSGTTGRAKGVAVRHKNVAMIPNNAPNWSGDWWMHSSPLFTFAGIGFIYNPMKMGMRGLYQPRFDVGRWLDAVEAHRPPMVFIVPAMAQLLIAHPRFAAADLSSIVMCSLGSAPLAPATLRRLQEKMPNANVANAYGMTEAGPAFCYMPQEESVRRIGSVGKPMPPMEVRAVDDAARDLPQNEVGEILIRLPGRQREYYTDPD